ncbi:hypothetical protein ACWIE7_17045 [Dietzia sp. NPDC055343]
MGSCLRRRRCLAAAFALVPVLVLSGCGQESSTIAADHTTASGAVTSSTAAANTDAAPLYEDVAPLLDSVRDEFGEVPVIVLYLFSDHALLTHADPSPTRTSVLRSTYRDGAWVSPTRDSRPSPGRHLSLDEINPDTVRAAVEAAPGASELTDPQIDHVGIGTGDTGEQEYVVSLTADDGDGSVIFSPDLRVLEISVYR